MEFILTGAYAFLFYYIIRKNSFFKLDSIAGWLPGLFFLLKCISGIFLGLIYTIYYTNHNDTDTFKFFTDSKIMFDRLFSNPLDFFKMFTGIDGKSKELYPYYEKMNSWLNTNLIFNDNKTIIRLNAFFRFFSLGYYNVHVIFINFISFAGLICLYKAFSIHCTNKKRELFIFIFLMPSVLFWGSGLLKDSILLSGFGLVIYSFTLLIKNGFNPLRLIMFTIGLLILAVTKTYVIAIILPGLFAWWITKHSNLRKVILTFLFVYGLYFFVAFNLYRFNPDYNIAALIFYKQKNFIDLGTIHNASMISFPVIECSALSILKNSPMAFCNTLFRPFLTDVHGNPMILLSAMENILIIFLIIACIISARKIKTDPIVIFNIIFITLLFVLIGMISPVLGAIVRYRIVALPCLMFVLIYFYDREKLIRRLSFFLPKNKKNGA